MEIQIEMNILTNCFIVRDIKLKEQMLVRGAALF
jgi:hypothetical protein